MSKITATRRLTFSAGHRVYNHESVCRNLHGHNYTLYLHAQAPGLDDIGRVIDFSVLKGCFGGWIDDNWDHAFLFWKHDRECCWLFDATEQFNGNKHFKCDFNPTAEEMARYLLTVVGLQVLQGTDVELTKVTLYETENCFAEVTL